MAQNYAISAVFDTDATVVLDSCFGLLIERTEVDRPGSQLVAFPASNYLHYTLSGEEFLSCLDISGEDGLGADEYVFNWDYNRDPLNSLTFVGLKVDQADATFTFNLNNYVSVVDSTTVSEVGHVLLIGSGNPDPQTDGSFMGGENYTTDDHTYWTDMSGNSFQFGSTIDGQTVVPYNAGYQLVFNANSDPNSNNGDSSKTITVTPAPGTRYAHAVKNDNILAEDGIKIHNISDGVDSNESILSVANATQGDQADVLQSNVELNNFTFSSDVSSSINLIEITSQTITGVMQNAVVAHADVSGLSVEDTITAFRDAARHEFNSSGNVRGITSSTANTNLVLDINITPVTATNMNGVSTGNAQTQDVQQTSWDLYTVVKFE